MKILVIGSGGREHAMAWSLAQSKNVETVWVAPGNGGTAVEVKCKNTPASLGDPSVLAVTESGQDVLIGFVQREGIALTVVGPELPLAEGIVDRFRAKGLAIVGPCKEAARLEASKVFSKSFMRKYGVRAAGSENFTNLAEALSYAKKHFDGKQAPLVIKADGLAAGKGVVIAADLAEAECCLGSFMKDGSLGAAGSSVVLEEFLEGKEVSVLAAVSVQPGGKGVIRPFVSARDHKRRFDGGQGPNTGGMGSIAPVPDFTPAAQKDFETAILQPTLGGMEAEGMDYRGFIFFGLMVKDDRCSLLEYNVRLGDPETQAVLPLADFDFAGLCSSILDGTLAAFPLNWKPGAVCAPVAVADGYPGAYRKGDPITLDAAALAKTGARIFIAGALLDEGAAVPVLRSSGGRVLAASAWGADADQAWTKAYEALGALSFAGMAYRKDIGRE
ncbi:phosphoribosylamine--glycine ligase [Treponema primitia]|uniref:phosphoribosylamine--glycine ligase n=1 Tax=Treponema primitia TaxID=88058 RepID=UPI0002554F78|nr:phosphoribosylamine--glycine ligase [Treponema primitia]